MLLECGQFVLEVFWSLRQAAAMHCRPFSISHRLSDWPRCTLEVRCLCDERVVMLPVRLLLERRGDRTFAAVSRALRCSKCGYRPAPVYLVSGHHRTFNHGPKPDRAVELVPPPIR